jgi:dihydrofolate reductase
MTTTRPTTIVYIATSLDGFIARLDGALDWLGAPPDGEDYGWAEFLASIDAIIMGRITFEQVLTFGQWPYEGKHLAVLSTTMESGPEHLQDRVEVSSLSPIALLRRLGGQGHERVYVDGGKTVQGFLRADLIDELVITRIPVLLGEGLPLFGELPGDMVWDHTGTEAFENGLVKSGYRRCR